MNLIANGRSVGRHAARIAMLSSRYDQVAASVLFHVGSDSLVAVLSAERRTREMMQVLNKISLLPTRRVEGTYKKPRPKMNKSITFCLRGSCSDLIMGRGRTQVPKSVAILIHAGA